MEVLRQSRLILFAIAVIVLLQAAAYVYLVRPLQEESAELTGELAARRKLLDSLEGLGTARHVPGDAVRLAQVRAQIPELPYPELLLKELRLLEAAGDVQMQYYNIQVGEQALAAGEDGSFASAGADGALTAEQLRLLQELGPSLYPVDITVEFRGGYVQIRRLLAEAESMRRIWHVTGFTLSEAQPLDRVAIHAPNRQLRAQFTFRAYFAPALQQQFPQPLPVGERASGGRAVPF